MVLTVGLGCVSMVRPALLWADNGDIITVTRAGQDSLRADPGSIITAAFVVSNSGDEPRRFNASTELPERWRLVSPSTREELVQPGKTLTVLISIVVDKEARVDDYEVTLNVSDVEDPTVRDQSTVVISVSRRDELSVSVFESPAFVAAGDTYEVELMLVNGGNATVNLANQVSTVPYAETSMQPARLTIGPREQAFVTITIESPRELYGATRQLINFTATFGHADNVVARQTVWVDLVSSRRNGSDKSSLPAYVKATGLYSDVGQAGQVEIGVKGNPVEGSDRFVDLMIRTPDLASSYLYGRRDEYRLSYGTDWLFIRLGDHPFTLSPLTEIGRLGRGVGVGASSGKVSAEVFASRNRVTFPRENQIGGTVTYELNKYADFSANYLDKTGAVDGQSISIRTRIYPVSKTVLDFEVGDGTSSNTHSSAYSLSAQSRSSWYSFSGRILSTGPEFPGYYSDYDNISTSLTLKANQYLSLQGVMQLQDRNFSSPSAGSVNAGHSYYEVGPSFETDALGIPIQVAANYLNRSTSTTGATYSVDQTESLFRLRSTVSIWKFNVGSRFETGYVESRILGQRIDSRKMELSTGARFSRVNYNIAFERQNGATLYRLQDRGVSIIRMTASSRLRRSTRVHVNAFSIHDPSYPLGQYSYVQGGIEHKFRFGHLLSVDASSSAVDSWLRNSHPDLSISYEVPLGIPKMGSKKTRLTGRVIDAESARGMKGIRVTMGRHSAVTNDAGEYTFDKPQPGRLYLVVDQTSIGIDRTTMVPNPLAVTIDRETRQLPTIAVSSSGGIDGSVQYSDSAPGLPAGVSNAIVEIYDTVGKFRVVADENGQFGFRKLRPGQWKARVVYARERSGYEIEDDEYTIQVLPGQTTPLNIRYVSKTKTINFVARGVAGKIAAADTSNVSPPKPPVVDGSEVDSLQSAETAVCIPRVIDGAAVHRVTEGETLGDIVDGFYCNGVYWPRLWLRNRAVLSGGSVTTDVFTLTVPSVRQISGNGVDRATEVVSHRVEFGETLSQLAVNYYGDLLQWPRIWLVNRRDIADPDVIYPGMILRVPAHLTLMPEEIKFLQTPLVKPDTK